MISIKKIFGVDEKFSKPLTTQTFNKVSQAINHKLTKEINIRNNKSQDENEKFKNELLNPIFNEITNLLADPQNPRKALRLNLIEALDELAFFEVLVPSSKNLIHTSGDLHGYLENILATSDKLMESLKIYGITEKSNKDEISIAIKKHIKNISLRVKALNFARKEIGDFNKNSNKDWFGFCFLSLSVFHEEIIRRHLNLNSIMIGRDKEQRLKIYTSWSDLASYDDNDILKSWEEILEMNNLKNIFDLNNL